MSKGLRFTLWTLSSLAVLWTLLSLAMLAGMGRMMDMDATRGSGMMDGGGMMGGGMMMSGMFHMALVLIVMLGLDALFVYLMVSSRRARPSGT